MPQAGPWIDEFYFEDVSVIQHPPRVPNFQIDPDDSIQCPSGIDEFNFDLDGSVIQHPPRVPDDSIQCPFGIDEFHFDLSDSHVQFGNLDAQSLHHTKELRGADHLFPFRAQEMV